MKLYFYFLKTPLKGESYIHIEECNAEEKPKSYTLSGNAEGLYKLRIPKSSIGKIFEGVLELYVVLSELNIASVKKIFSDYLNDQIDGKQKEIEKLKAKLKAVENMEDKNG